MEVSSDKYHDLAKAAIQLAEHALSKTNLPDSVRNSALEELSLVANKIDLPPFESQRALDPELIKTLLELFPEDQIAQFCAARLGRIRSAAMDSDYQRKAAHARSESLSASKRSEIARKAAKSRWQRKNES